MSLWSMGMIAVGRDLTRPGERLRKDPTATAGSGVAHEPSRSAAAVARPAPVGPGAVAPALDATDAAAGGATGSSDLASFAQFLIAQIPSEALIAYTTALAVFTSTSHGFTVGRWFVYGGAIVVCGAIVLSAYLAHRDYQLAPTTNGVIAKRHLPLLPMASAMLAMAVYGLTVPGSPLQAVVSTAAFAVWSVCLAVFGGVLMMIISPFLSRGNSAVPAQ